MNLAIKRALWGARSLRQKNTVVRGPAVPKVALTFDDGPSDTWTPKILSILDDHNAKCSFFMIGKHVEDLPDIAGNVVKAGHEPCVHLYSHNRKVADEDDLFFREIKRSCSIIQEATGSKPNFLRFPFAHMGRQRANNILKEHGLRTVHWSFSSMDSRRDSKGIVKRVAKWLFPGAIVLLHDGVGADSTYSKSRDATVDALPTILDNTRAMGFKPVTLSELLSS